MRPGNGPARRDFLLEEIAVFERSRVIRETGKRFVVMDTAPTGHTLLLLDATGGLSPVDCREDGDKGLLPLR